MNVALANVAATGNVMTLIPEDFSELENEVMASRGIPRVVDAEVFKRYGNNQRLQLMVKHGLYVFPTTELANWLDEKIGKRRVIEIGAGNGTLAKHLKIKATDNFSQSPDYRPDPKYALLWKQAQDAMAALGQANVTYGSNVLRIEAIDAVVKHKPEVTYGCFITHKYRYGDIDGNVFGVDEEKLIKRSAYIMVGNAHTHRNKRLLNIPHETFEVPGLLTRGADQRLNRIWMWEKTGK